ncbi:MAG TPA: chemotaxis protein CheW [Kofleriaceae bacterium]|nr:chemotaxis protein CheW [Kofleriaceae bacterium]
MTGGSLPGVDLLDGLRASFDLGFAEPAASAAAAVEELLAIRVAGRPYAVRLPDISALVVDRPVVALPTGLRSLLGVAGLRGALVAVHDLRTLLGLAAAAPPRWMIVTAGDPLALAFDGFERHLRLPAGTVATSGAVQLIPGDEPRPVLDLAAIRAGIERHVRATAPQETPP